ncbi:MAG: metallopeptidase TldD-related protein [Candidatus Nanoarchaeia archaeon]|nr:metallopeptidase TldD-related protein [Candidatus Nanoarchaeia archaeon]
MSKKIQRFPGVNDYGGLEEQQYLADILSGEICELYPKKLKDALERETGFSITPKNIYILGRLQLSHYFTHSVYGNQILETGRNNDINPLKSMINMKLGAENFGGYSWAPGIKCEDIRKAAQVAYIIANATIGERFGSSTQKKKYNLTASDFSDILPSKDFLQKPEFIIKPRKNIMDNSLEDELNDCILDLNQRIMEESIRKKAGICEVTTKVVYGAHDTIICNSGGTKASHFLPFTHWVTEVELDTGRNVDERKFSRCGTCSGPELIFDMFDGKNGQSIDYIVDDIVERSRDYINNSKSIEKTGWMPSKPVNIIMNPKAFGFMVHEVFGHMAEVDLAHANHAADFLLPHYLKEKDNKIAKDFVNMAFDPSFSDGLPYHPFGTMMIDDEGVLSRRVDILKEGRVVGLLNNLIYSKIYDMQPNGHSREDCIRMSHLIFDDSKDLKSPEEMLEMEGVKGNTFFIADASGGHTDESDLHYCLEIRDLYFIDKNGKMVPMSVKTVDFADEAYKTYSIFGSSLGAFERLQHIAAMEDSEYFRYRNNHIPDSGFCGKEHQTAFVSESCPFALFDNMHINANNEELDRESFVNPYKRYQITKNKKTKYYPVK